MTDPDASLQAGSSVPGGDPQDEGREAEPSPRGQSTLHPGRTVWHPDGPSIGIIRALEGHHVRVAFRDLGVRLLPVSELSQITPGDPVTVTFLRARPRLGETRQSVTVRQGEYVGPVQLEPSLSHVRIDGTLRRVPTEYIAVASQSGKAAAAAYSRRMARHPADSRQKSPDSTEDTGSRRSDPEVIQVQLSPEMAANQDRLGDRYMIRFGDLGGGTDVPGLAIEASGADPLALQVLQFARDRLPGRDVSVTVEDMRRGRVLAGREVAGHFTITLADQPHKATALGRDEAAVTGFRRGDLIEYNDELWTVAAQAAQADWQPAYAPWRHGGWYVTNIQYPGGAVGCVSRNYPDRKWRIACDNRPGAHQKYTYPNRDAAARAERRLVAARWERVAELAAGLAPVAGPGTTPNTADTPCASCGTVVRAGIGVEIPGAGMPPAVLDSTCSAAIAREQADPGGARAAPGGYARHADAARHGHPHALEAESFPYGPAAGLRPGSGAPVPPGQPAHASARRHPDQNPPATRGQGPR
jgi:hypothetical protein